MKTNYTKNEEKRYLTSLSLIITFALFFIVGISTQNINAQSGAVIYPTDDAYQRYLNGTTVYGQQESLLIQFHTDGQWRREAWLKFEIAGLDAEHFDSATVILSPLSTNANIISPMHTIRETTTNWSELTLVSAKKPTLIDVVLDSKEYTPGTPIKLDVTNILKTRLAEEKDTISFNIRPSSVAGALYFHSKESSQSELWPVLLLKGTTVGLIHQGDEGIRFKVANNKLIVSGRESIKTTIFDVTGKVILSKQEAQNSYSINISDLISGIYIVSLQSETGNKIVKIML